MVECPRTSGAFLDEVNDDANAGTGDESGIKGEGKA